MIFYFSGTGNSKYVSLKISKSLNIESISLNEYFKRGYNTLNNNNDDYLGFVFPTYDYDIPYVIKDYLKKANIIGVNDKTFVFSIVTCGAKTGNSYQSLNEILIKKYLKLNLFYSLKMVDNSIPWFKSESNEKKEAELKDADIKLDLIIDDIKNKKEIIKSDKPLNKLFKKLVDKLMINSQKSTKHFYVNDNCIACGKCERICPMNCIKIINNRPSWNANTCAACLSCVHRCPKAAIQYNKKTEKRARYYNPNVEED
jgi:NAD-dependent dihydropyrimidine dehydrogenase PreA subunit